MPLSQLQTQSQQNLEAAAKSRNAEAVEFALFDVFSAGLHERLAGVLVELAGAAWHTRHEDIALTLQELRLPESVAALECLALALHAYLEYDEFFGLARKCTWALADIGTSQAREALERLGTCENPSIAAFATNRLENWQHELHRKRDAIIQK